MPSNIEAKITQTARDNQFTVVGDGNHADPQVRNFVYRRDVMESLRDGGVKHVFIEVPQSLQHNADGLANGLTTRDQFVNFMSSRMDMAFGDHNDAIAWSGLIADQVLYAKNNGMKVHFADPENGEDKEVVVGPNMERLLKNAMQDTMHKHGIRSKGNDFDDVNGLLRNPELQAEVIENFNTQVAGLPPEEKQQVEQEIAEHDRGFREYNEARLNDEGLSDYITQIAGDQKSAVIYGAGHDDLSKRLTEGGYKNSVIEIYSSKEQREASDRLRREREGAENAYDNAAYLNTDTIESAPRDSAPAMPASPAVKAIQVIPAL